MKKILALSFLPTILLTPLLAAAQFGDVDLFVIEIGLFINSTLIPILLAVAFLVFIVGAVRFFLLAGDEYDDNKKKGKSLMLYGIIGFVLIVSIWGIVRLFSDGLGLQDDNLDNVPFAPTSI